MGKYNTLQERETEQFAFHLGSSKIKTPKLSKNLYIPEDDNFFALRGSQC